MLKCQMQQRKKEEEEDDIMVDVLEQNWFELAS